MASLVFAGICRFPQQAGRLAETTSRFAQLQCTTRYRHKRSRAGKALPYFTFQAYDVKSDEICVAAELLNYKTEDEVLFGKLLLCGLSLLL